MTFADNPKIAMMTGLRLPRQAAEDQALGALHRCGLLCARLVVVAQQVQQPVHEQDATFVMQPMPAFI